MPKKTAVKSNIKTVSKSDNKAQGKISGKAKAKEVAKVPANAKVVASAKVKTKEIKAPKAKEGAIAIPVMKPAEAEKVTKKSRIQIPPGLTGEALKLALKWRQLFEKNQIEPSPYKMSGHYEAKTPIKHKVLGWGFVLSSNNSRIEVLFQNGVKTLITDLKE